MFLNKLFNIKTADNEERSSSASTSKTGPKEIVLQSTITCPECEHGKEEIMPTESCQYFYECENCKTVLKPEEGDCCVYCSYGSVPCPPVQEGAKDCC